MMLQMNQPAPSSVLKMEAAGPFETLAHIHHTMQSYILEESNFNRTLH
jgi:hypothetical protein